MFDRWLPWWKAPLLLFKRPGVAVAIATATTVAILPAAGLPLLISASQSASIQQQVDDQCVLPSGASAAFVQYGDHSVSEQDGVVTEVVTGPTPEGVAEQIDQIDAELGQIDGMGPVERTLVLGHPEGSPNAPTYELTTSDGEVREVFVVYRDASVDRIQAIQTVSDDGVWLPDDLGMSADPGDFVALAQKQATSGGDLVVPGGEPVDSGESEVQYSPGSEPEDVEIPVAGGYRSLNGNHASVEEWCHLYDMTQFDAMPEGEWRPTVLLDEQHFWRLAGQANIEITVILQYELTSVPTLNEADRLSEELGSAAVQVEDQYSAQVTTDLPRFADRAELVGDTLWMPAGVVTLGAVLVGLCIVGAAGSLWVRRRSVELSVLAGRGVSPTALGGKGALEALAAVTVGGAAGYLLCRYSMPLWAPSDLVEPVADSRSVGLTALVVVLALLTVGAVATRATARLTEPVATRGRSRGRLPWELIPAGFAVVAWFLMDEATIATAGEAADRVGQVQQLPARVFLVPLLVAATCAMLVARIARWWWGRTRRQPSGISGFIAAARIRRDRAASAVMLAAITVPTALAGYAIVASASVGATIDAQARSEIGAEMVVDVDEATAIPDEITQWGTATPITRIDNLSLDRIQVSVLYVDVATFAQVSDTADLLADADVTELLGRPGVEGAIPVVAGGSDLLTDGVGTLKLPGPVEVEVDVAAVADLPGKRGGHPVVLISDEYRPMDLARVNSHQWWISTGDTAAVGALIDGAYPQAGVRLASERYDGTPKQALVGSMDYLLWVSLLTAVVVVVGILLRLESRSAANRRAFVMMRRMGLRGRVHWLALLREIGSLLTVGVTCGVATAAVLVAVMGADFDVDAVRAPGTVLSMPNQSVAWLIAATLITVLASAWLAHSRIAAAKPSEVLRDTG